jgi:hypothetical protein
MQFMIPGGHRGWPQVGCQPPPTHNFNNILPQQGITYIIFEIIRNSTVTFIGYNFICATTVLGILHDTELLLEIILTVWAQLLGEN